MYRDGLAIGADGAQGTRWLKMLDRFDVRFLALDLEVDRGLVEFFDAQPEWIVDCVDDESVLFVRSYDAPEREGLAAQGSALSA